MIAMGVTEIVNIEELKRAVKRLEDPIRREKVPTEYSRETGKPVAFEKVPVYAEGNEKKIGINCEGVSWEKFQSVSDKLSKELLSIWRPIVIGQETLLYPIDDSDEGYIVKYYKVSKFLKLD